MTLLEIIVLVLLFVLILWAISHFVTGVWKNILIIILIVIAIIILLNWLGVFAGRIN